MAGRTVERAVEKCAEQGLASLTRRAGGFSGFPSQGNLEAGAALWDTYLPKHRVLFIVIRWCGPWRGEG